MTVIGLGDTRNRGEGSTVTRRLPGPRELARLFPRLGDGLGLVWQAAPRRASVWMAITTLQGLLPVALAYFTRSGIDAIVGAGSGRITWHATLMPLAGVAATLIVQQGADSLASFVRTSLAELVQAHVHGRIHAQALALDLAFFEKPESFDLLHRARVDALSQPFALLEHSGAVARNALTLVGLAALLATYAPWVPALLLGAALPALAVIASFTLREHRWHQRHTVDQRRLRYYDYVVTQPEIAAELRLFDIGAHFVRAFGILQATLTAERIRIGRSRLAAELGAGLVALAGTGLALVWMVARLAAGAATLGDVVLFYQVFQQSQGALRTLLQSGGGLYRSLLFLEDLHTFFATPTQLDPHADPPAQREAGGPAVVFDDVTFRYPGSTRVALNGLSLVLPQGKVTAIVGTNGAGKSTLIKLLCRFYDPDAGRVLVGETDVRDMPIEALRHRMTVLFQEPVRFHVTVREAIAFGDWRQKPDEAQIDAAARNAGADTPIQRLAGGYDAVLGKWFGGAELSAGEWQRLALARTLVREAEVVMLDEPTSAMDSWAETAWLGRLRHIVAGRTVLLITHRFTTAMHADQIHVLHEGRLVESGTHKELIAAGGLYAASWQAQTSTCL